MTTNDRQRVRLLTRAQWAISAGLVLLTAAAVVAVSIVVPPAVRASAPDIPVKAYLQALVDGRVADALELAGVHPTKSDVLLTDAAYRRSSDRISAFAITGSSAAGGAGRVVGARITQGGARYDVGFLVQRSGAMFGLGAWHLATQTLPTLAVAVDGPAEQKVTIGGVAVPTKNGEAKQRVLPGTYEVAGVADPMLTSTRTSAIATLADDQPQPVALRFGVSDAGRAQIEAAVRAWLDGCAASTELAPPACPFRAVPQDGVAYSDGRWDIRTRPTLAEPTWSAQANGWRVAAATPGYASFTAHATQGSLYGTASTGDEPFGISGTAIRSGSGFTFQPSAAYADAGATGPLT